MFKIFLSHNIEFVIELSDSVDYNSVYTLHSWSFFEFDGQKIKEVPTCILLCENILRMLYYIILVLKKKKKGLL